MAIYGERLRTGFFNEVLEYWYRPGTQLPTNEQPTRQNHPLHSCYLTSFLVNMFNRNTMVVLNPKNPGTGREWKSDSATFGMCIIFLMYGICDGYSLLNITSHRLEAMGREKLHKSGALWFYARCQYRRAQASDGREQSGTNSQCSICGNRFIQLVTVCFSSIYERLAQEPTSATSLSHIHCSTLSAFPNNRDRYQ